MKAIRTQLNEQKRGQFKEYAIKCIEIYDALITIEGKVWDRSWQTLVICQWRATDYYYRPSKIGEIFLRGLNKNIEL